MGTKTGSAPTIDTIAARCGRSRTTVSAVLRGEAERYRISAATEAEIREAAAQAGWRPNFFARSLNKKRTDTIGVLFPDVFERFMGETIRGIEAVLQGAGMRMLLSTSRFDPDEELRAVEAFRYRGVDGLIIAPYAPFAGGPSRSGELVAAVGDLPCVVLDRVPDGLDPAAAGYGTVLQADRDAAHRATLFLARGPDGVDTPEPVAFVGFDLSASSLKERRRGYREAAAELGLEPAEILLSELNPRSSDLSDAVARLDRGAGRPRGYLVSTEGLAYKLAAVLTGRGRTLGQDVRVARFGVDPPWIATALIGLRQPHRELGAAAVELLLRLADGRECAAEPVLLPVEILPPPIRREGRPITFIDQGEHP